MKYGYTLLLGLLITVHSLAATRSISTIELYRTDASTLIPALQPLLSAESSITAYQNRLILNATTEETERIRSLVAQLDGSGRQLMIAVKVGEQIQSTQQEWTIEPQVHISNNSKLPTKTRVTVNVERQVISGQSEAQQGVRTSEGQRTFIVTGQKIPYQSTTASGQTIQTWHPANSGFYATAFVHEGEAVIDLEQSHQQGDASGISGQQLQSHISGPLNTWILVGYVLQHSQSSQQSGVITLKKGTDQQQQTVPVYLKVSPVR